MHVSLNDASADARWRLAACTGLTAPPPDWRDRLAERLGHRPRRLGAWAELSLFGALQCLHEAGEAQLPAQARLRLASRGGPVQAQAQALGQLRDGLPMPFAFMQSQPALTLAALAQALQWRGDGAFVAAREPQGLAALSLRGAAPEGALVGWVECGPHGFVSAWWRWRA